MQFFDPKTNMAAERKIAVRLLGGGAGVAPTFDLVHGMTLTRPATGRVLLAFTENPGTFVGIGGFMFGDTASQANVKGWTVTRGAYPASAGTFTIEIDIWNSTFAAADLGVASYLDLELKFSELKNP